MEEDIVLSPFALEPTKSHRLHCKGTARPPSPGLSYTPADAQAHGWMPCTWQRHASPSGAFPSWVSSPCRAPAGSSLQPWPHRTGAHVPSLPCQAGPGSRLLCLLLTPTFPYGRFSPCPRSASHVCTNLPAHLTASLPCWGWGADTAAGTYKQAEGSLFKCIAKAIQCLSFCFTPFTPILFWVPRKGEGRKHV